jgi:hypothetical protein
MKAVLVTYLFGESFCLIVGEKGKCPAQQCSQQIVMASRKFELNFGLG